MNVSTVCMYVQYVCIMYVWVPSPINVCTEYTQYVKTIMTYIYRVTIMRVLVQKNILFTVYVCVWGKFYIMFQWMYPHAGLFVPTVRFDNGLVVTVGQVDFDYKISGLGTVVRRQIPLKLAWYVVNAFCLRFKHCMYVCMYVWNCHLKYDISVYYRLYLDNLDNVPLIHHYHCIKNILWWMISDSESVWLWHDMTWHEMCHILDIMHTY